MTINTTISINFVLTIMLVSLGPSVVKSQTEDCRPGYKYPNPEKCAEYRMCISDESGIVWTRFTCPAPTVFCEDVQDCTSETFCPCGGTAMPTTTTETITTTTQASCTSQGDPGTSFRQASFGDNWYTFVWEPKLSWEDAVAACARNCSVLTSIWSVEEFQFLEGLLGDEYRAWVGGTDFNRAQYEWIENDMRVPDNLWSPGQPDSAGGLEDCVELWPGRLSTGINDWPCSGQSPFVCKFLQ